MSGTIKKFFCGHKVYQSTEKVISSKEIDGNYIIKTERYDNILLKPKNIKRLPNPGSMLTIHYICSSQIVGVSINGECIYFLEETDL